MTNKTNPSLWVKKFYKLINKNGKILDIASGNGRNGRFLLSLNFDVTFIDIDTSLLKDLNKHKKAKIVTFDLENKIKIPFKKQYFDGIIVVNYLYRPMLQKLINLLKPDGILIYETFSSGNEIFGKPSNPNYLLNTGELLNFFSKKLSVISYENGLRHNNKISKSIIQRICAIKSNQVLKNNSFYFKY